MGLTADFYVISINFINSYGLIGFFILEFFFTASVLFPLPADALVIFAGSAISPFLVGLIGGIAAGLGESVSYFIGKGGNYIIKEKHGKKFKKTEELFNRYGFWSLPVFAFTPFFSSLRNSFLLISSAPKLSK